MADKGYIKAQEAWNQVEPAFGQKVRFAEAFPTVATLRLEVTETNYGTPCSSPEYRTEHWFPKFVDCTNRSCKYGGVDVGETLRELVVRGGTHVEFNKMCRGEEYSGGKPYRSCQHGFQGQLSVSYKQPETTEDATAAAQTEP